MQAMPKCDHSRSSRNPTYSTEGSVSTLSSEYRFRSFRAMVIHLKISKQGRDFGDASGLGEDLKDGTYLHYNLGTADIHGKYGV